MSQVVLLTGGTSGIGLCTARALAKQGCRVYTLSRRGGENEPGITHLQADITREEQISAAVKTILQTESRIDIVINNAGFGISGAVEFTETAHAQKQFDVNFFGMVRVNHVLLPLLREQRSGRIVNISSVAGPIPIPFQTYYSAAKAAINSYTLSLQNEVKPFGITVCAIQPGDIRTGFTAARQKSEVGDAVYNGRISRSVATMEKDEQGGMAPETAGQFICRVALKRRSRPLLTIGVQYKLFCMIVKLLPRQFTNWLVGLIYAD